MYAVIKTGGKQYRVAPGDTIRIERVEGKVGEDVTFGSVLAVQARRLRRDKPDAVLELLAADFEPGEPPGGGILLRFAGGGDLRLEVECVDAALADLTEPWPARRAPAHDKA